MVALRLQRPDLCRDIRLEGAVSEDQEDQSREEHAFNGQQEVSDSHEHSSQNHGPPLPKKAGPQA